MIYDDRTDLSEGIDINKTCKSKKCDICCCWYFLNKGFTFQQMSFPKCLQWKYNTIWDKVSSDIKT